jgi:hypothetical protein
MAIKEKLTLVAPEGQSVVLLDDWARSVLPAEELPLFEAAKQRHDDFISSKASSTDPVAGEAIFDDQTKKDEASAGGDMDFLFYWYRYLTENNITVEKSVETV